MPTAKLGLLGAAQGPLVDISTFSRPGLDVFQLPEGAVVVVQYDDGRKVELFSNDTHRLERGGFVSIRCLFHKKHETICKFVQAA